MTENRRIALDTLATNGRSLFTLVRSLGTSRWILMAFGHSGLRNTVAVCGKSLTIHGAEQESNHLFRLVRHGAIC